MTTAFPNIICISIPIHVSIVCNHLFPFRVIEGWNHSQLPSGEGQGSPRGDTEIDETNEHAHSHSSHQLTKCACF